MTITLSARGVRFPSSGGETILEAALLSNIPMDYACDNGACGACKVRKISGDVDLGDVRCLEDDEKEEGWILTCRARAKSDLVLEC